MEENNTVSWDHLYYESKKLAAKITKAANLLEKRGRKALLGSYVIVNSTFNKFYKKSIIIDSMQQGVVSPFFDERLLYSDNEWRKELSKADIKYLKTTLFDTLFDKPFDEYAKGIQSTEEKINLVHSRLKSMYREQQNFLKSLEKE